MVADHEDYLPGEAPAAHAATHQEGGADEVNIEGLTGVTSYMAAHILLPTVHQDAPALILTHKGDAGAHHARYTDGEAVTQADARIAIHAALPTVHQDAPALILTHKGDASAHHAKYTDVNARASINNIFGADGKADSDINLDTHKLTNVTDPVANQDADTKAARAAAITTHTAISTAHHTKYTDAEARAAFSAISVSPNIFKPSSDLQGYDSGEGYLKCRGALDITYFLGGLFLPNGATLTKFYLYGYRDDAAASMALYLRRHDWSGNVGVIGEITANWTDGYGGLVDDSLTNAVVNNSSYTYYIMLVLNPNDSVNDVSFKGAVIEFTG